MNNDKSKIKPEEDKELPPHLISKLVGRKPEESVDTMSNSAANAGNSSDTPKHSAKEIIETDAERDTRPADGKITAKAGERRNARREGGEISRQMNVGISRQHFREAQRLLTDIKLFADEELNKSFSNANLVELLIEIARDLYAKDPDAVEQKVRNYYGK